MVGLLFSTSYLHIDMRGAHLTGVLPARFDASTDHILCDEETDVTLALLVSHYRQINLL